MINIKELLNNVKNKKFKIKQAYSKNASLTIKVGKVDSIKTQLPFSYFYLPTCGKHSKKETQSLGEILSGESIYVIDYEANLLKNEYCKILCYKNLKDF